MTTWKFYEFVVAFLIPYELLAFLLFIREFFFLNCLAIVGAVSVIVVNIYTCVSRKGVFCYLQRNFCTEMRVSNSNTVTPIWASCLDSCCRAGNLCHACNSLFHRSKLNAYIFFVASDLPFILQENKWLKSGNRFCTVAQKGHTCKLKMLLQIKYVAANKVKLLQIRKRCCKLKERCCK